MYLLAAKLNRARGGPQDAGNRIEQGGFSCPIGADDGNNQRFLNLNGDIPKGVEVMVKDIECCGPGGGAETLVFLHSQIDLMDLF
jgi:hypothetical protein